MSVLYRLARPGGEYNRLYALMKREVGDRKPLGWPTVVAEENGKVVAFLSTVPCPDAVIAGPLVIEGRNRPFVFLRLCEAYENLLKASGVKVYTFCVSKQEPERIKWIDENMGFPRLGEDDQRVWFQRSLS